MLKWLSTNPISTGVLECFRASFRALFGRSSSTSILMLFYAIRCGGMVQYVHFFCTCAQKIYNGGTVRKQVCIFFSRTLCILRDSTILRVCKLFNYKFVNSSRLQGKNPLFVETISQAPDLPKHYISFGKSKSDLPKLLIH